MGKRRRRRTWSDDEKRMICGQTRLPGVSVSQVARRYDVNANQVFNWLKDPRFVATDDDVEEMRFLPVEIVDDVRADVGSQPTSNGHLQFELTGGHRLSVSGAYDPDTLARLIRGLSE